MRNTELRHLQVRDIDSRRMLIHIQHSSRHPRTVALVPACAGSVFSPSHRLSCAPPRSAPGRPHLPS
jgi:hypothetical protein